jgi:hypothetical protein
MQLYCISEDECFLLVVNIAYFNKLAKLYLRLLVSNQGVMVPPFIVTCDTPLRDFNRSATDRRGTVLGNIFREAIRTVFSTVINVFPVFGYFCHSALQYYVYGEVRPSKLVIIDQEDPQHLFLNLLHRMYFLLPFFSTKGS